MTAPVSRAFMAIAGRCLGTDGEEWALAMRAEFEAAVDDGEPFTFAIGCLMAACRAMVKQGQGRLVVANYALALGLLLPMAALQFEQAVGVSMAAGKALPHGMLAAGAGQNPYLVSSQNSAVPVLLILWLLLGTAHACLAWVLVEEDWPGVVRFGALIGAATISLFLFKGVLMLDLAPLAAQFAELALELAAIAASAHWHVRLFSQAAPQMDAG